MDGYRGRDYYTIEEFNDGCTFNFWMGAAGGVLGTIGTFFGLAWLLNWI